MGGIFGKDTTDTIARMLAGEHAQEDPLLRHVYVVPHPDEVRLIEVTESVPASGEVLPFRFAPEPGVPFKTLVVQIHPDDWARRDKLSWPTEIDPTKQDLEHLDLGNGVPA